MRRQVFVIIVVMLSTLTTVAHASVMLGAFVAGNGWKQENILSLNEQLHKELSFITLFSAFTEDWDQLYWQTSKVASAGMVPMISWMPIDQNRQETNILPEIVAGQWDAYLIEWSERFIAWRNSYDKGQRPDILLRFGHEFNGNWYSYSDSPDLYKNAWRYIHNLFEKQGVNEYIEWVWCANNLNIDSINDITRYYPGDEFVDWTSIDGYNWGTNYSWTSWETFTEVYADMYSTMVSNYPDKPIVIAEYGSAEPADVPDPVWGQNGDDSDFNENKDAWVRDMLGVLEENLPAIRAVSLFNINKELGWSITDAGNTGLAGMNHGLVSDYFVSTYIAARGDRRQIAEGPASTDNTNPSEPPIAYAYDSDFFRAQEQQRRAQSRALPQINRDSVERMRQGFLIMSPQGRARLKDLKLSVLNGG